MKYGSLFSGAGLGDFGYEMAGLEVAWQVENNEYCRKILDLRWPEVKKYGDIKTIKPEELGPVDLITGGFPCQPFSVAGNQYGADDDRNLWPKMFRIIKALKPRWVVAENVPGIIPIYLDTVLADLENEGYTCWPVVFSSHSLGAWHRRERLWIIAFSGSERRNNRSDNRGERRVLCNKDRDAQESKSEGNGRKCGISKVSEIMGHAGLLGQKKHEKQATGLKQPGQTVPDPKSNEGRKRHGNRKTNVPNGKGVGIQRHGAGGKQEPHAHGQEGLSLRQSKGPWESYWNAEPNVGRVVNGCPNRVDRLKALGNGQTPCSTYAIGKWIMEIENSPCSSPATNATKHLNTSAGIPEAGRK